MKQKILFTLSLVFLLSAQLRADEGMWLPLLIEKYNIGDMQDRGLRLSAEDIYSINQDCLKDAVMIFGRGCTGELISDEGLLLTNHHCGYGAIQRHSSVEQDYLTDGFWAMSKDEELPNKGLTVTFLRYIKDVSEEMASGAAGDSLVDAETEGTHFTGRLVPMYYGNAHYIFIYETFKDVRLVGAPPESIGNFGSDQDNWMWPRHTGDFSMFRIYADANNEPADYAADNKPYKPRKHLEIAAGGIDKGDFTMVMGYPGSTTSYLYSAEVEFMLEENLPMTIDLRTTRLEIMDKYMRQSDKVRIQYSSKYRGVSNAWKKWQGIILGLTRNDAVNVKLAEEEAFAAWVAEDAARQEKYGDLLDGFASVYEGYGPVNQSMDMIWEAVLSVELFGQSRKLSQQMSGETDAAALKASMEGFYKDYHMPVDQEIFAAMMLAYDSQMPADMKPELFAEVHSKYGGDFTAFASKVYATTLLNDKEKLYKLFDAYEKKPEKALAKLEKDPVFVYLSDFLDLFRMQVLPEYREVGQELDGLYTRYMAALLEMAGDSVLLYPDANFTMRVTYGEVKAYEPRDAVDYKHYTNLSGVIAKSGEEFEDYRIPDRLRELYDAKDYGPYGVDGTMPVCFIAANHTSGGNSGSPVMDADGRLIGINFDRNWEGTMSDVHYDPNLCRNISVDIRYILFIIDKFAGAGYLLDEMDIVWEKSSTLGEEQPEG